MIQSRLLTLLGVVSLVGLIVWVASNTYWIDITVPMPPKGEALTNPFYAVQRFAGVFGARTAWNRTLDLPATDGVMVISAWHWNLTASRREALERWVESGGRLVIDRSLTGGTDDFERWSGIFRQEDEESEEPSGFSGSSRDAGCRPFREEPDGTPSTPPRRHVMCDLDGLTFLSSKRHVEWALRDGSGALQAIRVGIGRGKVTVLNATPFRGQNLFEGDHGWLFLAATELRTGDVVRFLSEDDHPSLLALLWRHGAPAVTLWLALLALLLWRGGVRFGPLAPPPDTARRSMAEQIRGTGQFALRHGSGDSLHAASVRALDETAERRVAGYVRLSVNRRAAALERLTGVDGNALAAAVRHGGTPHELRNAIALLESARRQILTEHTRTSHGTD